MISCIAASTSLNGCISEHIGAILAYRQVDTQRHGWTIMMGDSLLLFVYFDLICINDVTMEDESGRRSSARLPLLAIFVFGTARFSSSVEGYVWVLRLAFSDSDEVKREGGNRKCACSLSVFELWILSWSSPSDVVVIDGSICDLL